MFDKEKIINITEKLQNFVRTFPNIYIWPETLGINVPALLKRLDADITAILVSSNDPQKQNLIRNIVKKYPIENFSFILSNINEQTGIVISAAKSVENPNLNIEFRNGDDKISVPAFSLTDEEAQAIYDRMTMTHLLNQYQDDGVIGNGMKDISSRFARGISTFIDSRFQDVKVQVWDRRELKASVYEIDDTAIVIQGPLEYKDNYTLTTAQIYREWYPNAPIVISTWKNEMNDDFRNECKKIGVVLLENNFPAESAFGHINHQLESSLKGIEHVKEHTNAKFVLKCRTDQRINRADFLVYFKNLLKTFPPNGDKLNERIIVLESDRWTPFYICDFLYFGTLNDINKLFKISPATDKDNENFEKFIGKFHPVRIKLMPFRLFKDFKNVSARKLRNYNIAMNKFIPAEIFIMKNFYETNIEPVEPSKLLQTYWKFLRDYLIVVDDNDILFEWLKYQYYSYSIPSYYYGVRSCSGIDHIRWLDIYLNYKDDELQSND